MIEITLANGETRTWNREEYTEYDIRGRFFVVIRNEQWVGMYGLDSIIIVEIRN